MCPFIKKLVNKEIEEISKTDSRNQNYNLDGIYIDVYINKKNLFNDFFKILLSDSISSDYEKNLIVKKKKYL